MRRTYTRERYLDRVALIREHVPDAAITTDIIVGFPGETEADFAQTLEVCEEVGYDSAFTFIFSPRRGTEAGAFTEGLVAHEEKVERMQRLVEVVQRRAAERAQRFVGRSLDVLVEGTSRTDPVAPARALAPQQGRELQRAGRAGRDRAGADHGRDEPDARSASCRCWRRVGRGMSAGDAQRSEPRCARRRGGRRRRMRGDDRRRTRPPAKRPIPQSLRVVESGAEDTTDFVLAGERAKAVKSANALDDAAQGDAASDLADADVPAAQIEELKVRAAEVKRIAARGKPINVALAANRAFELVPDFFTAYTDPVPAQVTRLDYLEFEAKLRALAGDRGRTADAVSGLRVAWKELRKKVVASAGGAAANDALRRPCPRMRDLVEADASLRADRARGAARPRPRRRDRSRLQGLSAAAGGARGRSPTSPS